MLIFATVLFALSALSLVVAAAFFVLCRIFERKHAMLESVSASLQSIKHKRDVPVYERNGSRTPRRIVMIIKHWSRGKYEYTVNNKKYRIHYVDFVTPRNLPMRVLVVYWKRFPKIAYVKTETSFHHFEIYAFAALLFSMVSALWGFSVIFH